MRSGQQLSDLGSDMINAYQIATQIYNDRVEKIRTSYLANVKNAKAQVDGNIGGICLWFGDYFDFSEPCMINK